MNRASKPTLAFVDHSFHKKTHSTDFLKELLRNDFQVFDYWDTSWSGGAHTDVAELNTHEYVLFFQTINPLYDLKKITAKMIWIPMYGSMTFDNLYWKILATFPLKVICFSKKVYDQCIQYGIQAISVQYYFEPNENEAVATKKGNYFFFWYRGHITFNELKRVLRPEDVDGFIYKSTPDPFTKKEDISEEDIKKYKIEKIESDFIPKDKYLELLSRTNIYIAPRMREGIGMSFLEAMSLGHVVVGNNEATLNEYVENNLNGYLFDRGSSFIDFKDIASVRKNSLVSAKNGHEKWKKDRETIGKFISSDYTIKGRTWSLRSWFEYALYVPKMIKNKLASKLYLYLRK